MSRICIIYYCMGCITSSWNLRQLCWKNEYQQRWFEEADWWSSGPFAHTQLLEQKSINTNYWWDHWYFLERVQAFINCSGPFSYCPGHFKNDDALSRRSHIWHEMHSLPFTQSFASLFCCMTVPSKWFGIGSAGRSWSNVKMIKDEKHFKFL